jgi:hypothetical protein
MPSQTITLEPAGANDAGPCDCCGTMTRTVWGYLYDAGAPLAAYYVHWTPGRIDHGAQFDLVMGKWGDQASPKDRSVVSVAFRRAPTGPQFMVTDAAGRPAATPGVLADTALRRDQVIGTPLAPAVFAMLDTIWLHDPRIAELTQPL